jgi:hypothetical protein
VDEHEGPVQRVDDPDGCAKQLALVIESGAVLFAEDSFAGIRRFDDRLGRGL